MINKVYSEYFFIDGTYYTTVFRSRLPLLTCMKDPLVIDGSVCIFNVLERWTLP
jgi:hypothetical protein